MHRIIHLFSLLSITTLCLFSSCQDKYRADNPANEAKVSAAAETDPTILAIGKEKLSEYHFFKGKIAELIPAPGILPYDINTPLFTDYAHKKRFIKLPDGKKISYNDNEVLGFPVGTVLIKNFYYPADVRKPDQNWKIIETRLLIKEDSQWTALPYIWNEEQTEAYLEITGGRKKVQWLDNEGNARQVTYSVPNIVQCKSCHTKNNKLVPIGPSARQLNKEYPYSDGNKNQLAKWNEIGWIQNLPELSEVPRLAVWNDPSTGDLNHRARAWLDINCGHCHNPKGPGNTSGLFLHHEEKQSSKIGIYKTPVAAGRGSGGRKYDILPGQPDESIMIYRMESDDPGIMMPELGRTIVDKEGVELIKKWIRQLERKSS